MTTPVSRPPAKAPLQRRQDHTSALLISCFGALLAFLDVTIVNVAFPDIQASFTSSSISSLSWVLNAYNIAFAALLVPAGRFADLVGRRRTFNLGIALFTLASVWCAVSTSLDMLVAARVVQAVGAAALVPASLALVLEAFPGARRAHAVGIWGATAAVASGLGPPLGGVLVQAQGWRLAFLVNLPFGLLALWVGRRRLTESRAPGRRSQPDLMGTGLLALALALVTLGIVQGPDWGWTSVAVLGSFALTAATVVAFVARSRQVRSPVLDPKLLRIPTFAWANIALTVAGAGFYAYMLNNILWLHYIWSYGYIKAGLAVAPGALVAAVVAGALGKVADQRGHRLVAVPGSLIWAGAYVWYHQRAGLQPAFLSEWLPGQVISGIGVGMTLPILSSAALAAVPGGRYAGASAITSATRQLGAVLGISLLVVVVGSPQGAAAVPAFQRGWVFSIVCFVAAAAVSVAVRRPDAKKLEVPDQPVGDAILEVNSATVETTDPGAPPANSMLARLPQEVRAALLSEAELVELPAGAPLFAQGDPTDAIYVVRSGRVEVLMGGEVVNELGHDAVLGELGVLTGAPRSAGIRARRDSHLLRITPAQWQRHVDSNPAALRALAVGLAEQVQRSRGSGATRDGAPKVVSLVALDQSPAFASLAEQLSQLLHQYLTVVTPGRVGAAGLARAEADADRVLLVAGPDDDAEWHAFCRRQADWSVLVAAATTSPSAPNVPESSGGTPDAATFVLLVGQRPSREALISWHDRYQPRHVLVAETGGGDSAVRSLAARIAGRSIGVAVAGGGARSFAAIGVMEELEAAGVVVERFSGVSMGSIVAGLFALGHNAAAVDAVIHEEFVRRTPTNDYTFPSQALIRGRKTEAGLARWFDVHMEELPRSLAVASTDLLNRELVVHRRGHLATVLRASLSLPALYPPKRIGNTLHVDGGLLDNMPIEPLATGAEGPVIAVNISAGSTGRSSGAPRIPALGDTLLRSLLMAGAMKIDESRAQAAIVVTPDTRGIGLLEFHQLDRLREAGQIAGRAVVEALRDLPSVTVPAPRAALDTDLEATADSPLGSGRSV